jgi:hypothetical protein
VAGVAGVVRGRMTCADLSRDCTLGGVGPAKDIVPQRLSSDARAPSCRYPLADGQSASMVIGHGLGAIQLHLRSARLVRWQRKFAEAAANGKVRELSMGDASLRRRLDLRLGITHANWHRESAARARARGALRGKWRTLMKLLGWRAQELRFTLYNCLMCAYAS